MPVNWLSATTRAVRPVRVVGGLRQASFVRYPSTTDNVSARKAAFSSGSSSSYSASTATTSTATTQKTGPATNIASHDVRNAHSQALTQFTELLTLSNQRSISGSQELVDIQGALEIYNELKHLKIFYPSDVAKLVQSIHASSRMSSAAAMRGKVISTQKKRILQDQMWLLLNCVEVVGQDVLDGNVNINAFGLMQFFSCYGTMKDPNRGLLWYKKFRESDNQQLVTLVNHPKVTGAVVELMILNGSQLEEIEKVYIGCNSANRVDINLHHTMCRAYLYFGKTTEALKMFNNIVTEYNGVAENDNYFARVHDSFIGDCQDINIAKSFFYEAVNGTTPYACTIHPSGVHRLMERCWKTNSDFSEIFKIWTDYLGVVSNRREREYNIVTYSLMFHFMEKYPIADENSYSKLKEIIAAYSKKMPNMGMLFLNTLLTNVSKWHDLHVTNEIIASYDIYGIEKGFDAIRVILNALRDIPGITREQIDGLWAQRLSLSRPLEVYDFFSLAKACEREDDPSFAQYFAAQLRNFLTNNNLRQDQVAQFEQSLYRYIQIPKNNLSTIRDALQLEAREDTTRSAE